MTINVAFFLFTLKSSLYIPTWDCRHSSYSLSSTLKVCPLCASTLAVSLQHWAGPVVLLDRRLVWPIFSLERQLPCLLQLHLSQRQPLHLARRGPKPHLPPGLLYHLPAISAANSMITSTQCCLSKNYLPLISMFLCYCFSGWLPFLTIPLLILVFEPFPKPTFHFNFPSLSLEALRKPASLPAKSNRAASLVFFKAFFTISYPVPLTSCQESPTLKFWHSYPTLRRHCAPPYCAPFLPLAPIPGLAASPTQGSRLLDGMDLVFLLAFSALHMPKVTRYPVGCSVLVKQCDIILSSVQVLGASCWECSWVCGQLHLRACRRQPSLLSPKPTFLGKAPVKDVWCPCPVPCHP